MRVQHLAVLLGLTVTLAIAAELAGQPPRGQRQRGGAPADAADQAPAPRVLRPTVFAITGARVVTEPGQVLPKANVVVRDGLIEAVGPDVPVPGDALRTDGTGLTVYPGFIDALSNWGFDPALRRSEVGPTAAEDFASEALAATKADNRKGLTPEFAVGTAFKNDDAAADGWRKAGFTAHLIAPDGGIIVGSSALVSLSGSASREAILRSPVALHAAFRTAFGQGSNDYPRALMGIIAHCRQTLLDAGHYQRLHAAFEKNGRAGRRPPVDPALEALGPMLDGKVPVAFEADRRDEIDRALDFAAEFQLKPMIYGGRDAWKVAERLKREQVPVLLRINLSEPNAEREKELPQRIRDEHHRLRDEEAACAAALAKAGVPFAICTQGQSGDQPGVKFRENLRKVIAAGLPADAALKALTTDAARLLGVERQVGKVASGLAANLTVTDGDFQAEKTQVKLVFADGVRFEYDAKAPDGPVAGGRGGRRGGGGSARSADDRKPEDPPRPAEEKAVAFVGPPTWEDVNTEIETDRKPTTHTGGNAIIANATVLTVTNGTLTNTDVHINNGKITALKPHQSDIPSGYTGTAIDGSGLFVMPGIIDTHCHFAVAGGVNEFSLSVVPEVRVRDVVDGEDVQIYRALAGGVTTARLLHGSANCVGGQDAVIKLKYGKPGRELIVADGPRGVKFALGENVKRTDGRFPNTRLGVEAVLVRAFTEAREYQKLWDEYRADPAQRPEPRRDLRLEALADILKGDLKVHCHCYRADEILMLLRVADRFGFKVKSLQHVLEGYKIAPEIAAHGASCSLFSDWWAYKIEAYDAIPYAAALVHEAGGTVCLKSDSNELMRHMYQEAAKVVKYGGMSETDALKAIALNGAQQLGLDQRIGSIEVGKDADLAIFNGHPLNSYSRVEMTLVEGEVYFQRERTMRPEPAAVAGPATPRDALKNLPSNPNLPVAIRGVTLHPVTGPIVSNATVVFEQGRIRAVGQNGGAVVPPQAAIINADGMHLYPGMIDAGTVLGLQELESARETLDFREGGDFQPDLRASTAINPDSELIPVTRANGVTTVVTRPVGSVVAGQGALINLAGWVPREMVVVDPIALHVEFPASSTFDSGDPSQAFFFGRGLSKKQRDEKVRRLKELFAQAVAYDEGRKASSRAAVNPRLDALVPYARGQKPVIIQAQRKPEIVDALKLADELKLKVIISGGTDAWKVAGELKKRDVPVIVGPIMTMPQEREDPFDAPFTNPAKLHAAGVRFCIRSAGSSNARNLPYEAAFAVSYGLPPEEGLKAVTLYPAQILGVADQLGSVEVGKRANLVLTNGDILQASTQVLAVVIDGKTLEPTSKQTKLYERYRERLREVREGKAPLGTN